MVALQSSLYDNLKRTGSNHWQNAVAPVVVTGKGLSGPSRNIVSFRNEDGAREWIAANAAKRVQAALVASGGEKLLASKRQPTITLARAKNSATSGSATALQEPPAVPPLTPSAPTAPWTPAQSQPTATSFSAVAPTTLSIAATEEARVLPPAPVAAEAGFVPPAGKVAETVVPASPAAVAASPAAVAPAANGRGAIEAWGAEWRAEATTTPCGSCTGRACAWCSIRIGKPPAGTLPSGYSPRILQYHNQETLAANTVAKGAAAPLEAPAASGQLLAAAASNAIVLENQKPGSPESEWMIDNGDPTIEGYAAQFSLNHGQRVDFKINTDSKNYRIDIYRLGYYGGMGAHKVTTINKTLTTAQAQPVPIFDPTTKLVDAGNWSVSASWDVPADAVSGIYYAKLTRLDGSRGENMIPFIVRDDDNPSDITFQTSDTTWQAYNWWGGYNFYGGKDEGGRAGRAYKVSYNRPIITRDGGFAAGPQDFIFGAEYPAIRWLEQNGYDVNYITGIDTQRQGAQLLNSKVFLSVGHDEYWSQGQRDNVEAARDAGVNLAFLSGNEVYWETRWETSIDGTGTPYQDAGLVQGALGQRQYRHAGHDLDLARPAVRLGGTGECPDRHHLHRRFLSARHDQDPVRPVELSVLDQYGGRQHQSGPGLFADAEPARLRVGFRPRQRLPPGWARAAVARPQSMSTASCSTTATRSAPERPTTASPSIAPRAARSSSARAPSTGCGVSTTTTTTRSPRPTRTCSRRW